MVKKTLWHCSCLISLTEGSYWIWTVWDLSLGCLMGCAAATAFLSQENEHGTSEYESIPLKRNFTFQTSMFRFHVDLVGWCTSFKRKLHLKCRQQFVENNCETQTPCIECWSGLAMSWQENDAFLFGGILSHHRCFNVLQGLAAVGVTKTSQGCLSILAYLLPGQTFSYTYQMSLSASRLIPFDLERRWQELWESSTDMQWQWWTSKDDGDDDDADVDFGVKVGLLLTTDGDDITWWCWWLCWSWYVLTLWRGCSMGWLLVRGFRL